MNYSGINEIPLLKLTMLCDSFPAMLQIDEYHPSNKDTKSIPINPIRLR